MVIPGFSRESNYIMQNCEFFLDWTILCKYKIPTTTTTRKSKCLGTKDRHFISIWFVHYVFFDLTLFPCATYFPRYPWFSLTITISYSVHRRPTLFTAIPQLSMQYTLQITWNKSMTQLINFTVILYLYNTHAK